MSGDKKSKRRRRDRDRADDNDRPVRGSGVDYSKVADRHIDDDRFENHRKGVLGPATADPGSLAAASGTPAAAAAPPKVSSQMTAVMRLMAGMEERTISEKLAIPIVRHGSNTRKIMRINLTLQVWTRRKWTHTGRSWMNSVIGC